MRTSKIKIDPETGLPELPEGCFWEVRQNNHRMYDYPRLDLLLVYIDENGDLVQLSHEIESFWSSRAEDIKSKHIVRTARKVYRTYEKRIQKVKNRAFRSPFVGKYPPKKL